MEATEQDRLISVGELAKLLNCSEQTSRRVLDSGRLPLLRLGPARVRFTREADALKYCETLSRAVADRAIEIAVTRGVPRAVATKRINAVAAKGAAR